MLLPLPLPPPSNQTAGFLTPSEVSKALEQGCREPGTLTLRLQLHAGCIGWWREVKVKVPWDQILCVAPAGVVAAAMRHACGPAGEEDPGGGGQLGA